MEQANVIRFAKQFKRLLSPETVNQLGRKVRFFQRERVITPFRLAVSLLASAATGRVETLADIQRSFNALHGTEVAYKPFHNQLAKSRFGDFMRELVEKMLEQWVVKVLEAKKESALGVFRQIVIQDGSSFAVNEALSTCYPGRFKSCGPAAVELHVTMDLLNEAVSRVALTPDTFPERPELPEAHSLSGCLLLADRGYFDVRYLSALVAANASFVVRGYTSLNPTVINGFGDRGKSLKRVKGRPLQEIRLPKRGTLDLDVQWDKTRTGKDLGCRMVASWDRKKREYRYLVTNLPREGYSAQQVVDAYRLRWQVELLFKEWKSYANLHSFDTENPAIAEGMIWTAIAASTLKRFLAHTTQLIKGVEVSTRKVAMCAHLVLDDIFKRLVNGKSLVSSFNEAFDYLAVNARRSHPQRDRRKDRLKLDLEPITGMA
jgi:hypothetical protein